MDPRTILIRANSSSPEGHSSSPEKPNLMAAVITSTIFIHIITLAFIIIRAYANIWTRTLRLEDIFSYVAWIALIIQTALIAYNSSSGMAQHTWDIDVATMVEGGRRYNTIFIFYTVSGGFAKATVFLQLKRIFTTALKGIVYWVIIASLVFNALAYTAFLFLYIFTCWPRQRIWNSTVAGRCMDSNRLNMAIGALNTISDIEAFIVPAWAIWQLRLDIRKKLSVFAVFAVGALAVAIGCMGMYYRVMILKRPDKTWLLTQTAIICMAELGIVIIVGCCPYVPRILRLRQRNSYNNAYSVKPGASSPRSRRSKLNTLTESRSCPDGTTISTDSDLHLEAFEYAPNSHNTCSEARTCNYQDICKSHDVDCAATMRQGRC